eukprot:28017-Chlamydomonas_euryale.AAC.1
MAFVGSVVRSVARGGHDGRGDHAATRRQRGPCRASRLAQELRHAAAAVAAVAQLVRGRSASAGRRRQPHPGAARRRQPRPRCVHRPRPPAVSVIVLIDSAVAEALTTKAAASARAAHALRHATPATAAAAAVAARPHATRQAREHGPAARTRAAPIDAVRFQPGQRRRFALRTRRAIAALR